MTQPRDPYLPIRERYQAVLARMASAAARTGRPAEAVRLVVVTKGQPLAKVQAVLQAGAQDLGENYPEEGVAKMEAIGQPDIRWHMIGHVQRRKAKLVLTHYDMLHSLDRLTLAQRLERLAAAQGRVLPVLLEINVGGEASKFGWPGWDEAQWPRLLPEVESVLQCAHLQVQGLMTVPPPVAEAEQARPYFQRLRKLRDFLAARFPQARWDELSMGMSADFEVAIEEGATMVRVGTAILGPRTRL